MPRQITDGCGSNRKRPRETNSVKTSTQNSNKRKKSFKQSQNCVRSFPICGTPGEIIPFTWSLLTKVHSANKYFWIFCRGPTGDIQKKSGYELKMNFLRNTLLKRNVYQCSSWILAFHRPYTRFQKYLVVEKIWVVKFWYRQRIWADRTVNSGKKVTCAKVTKEQKKEQGKRK